MNNLNLIKVSTKILSARFLSILPWVVILIMFFPMSAQAAILDWSANAWAPTGGLTETYSVGGSNVIFAFEDLDGGLTTTADGSPGSPETNIFQTGGTGDTTLFIRTNFTDVFNDEITITIDFTHPGGVSDVSFSLFDMDAASPQWIDESIVTATNGTNTFDPSSIISSVSNQVIGTNTVRGTSSAGNTSANGNATFTFNQTGITQITIVYSNATGTSQPPNHNQWISLHDITFDVPPTVTKQFSPSTITAGGVSTLTIDLGNNDTTAATLSSSLVDNLPAGVTVASPANIGGTCPGTINAPVGGGTITYTNGSSIPAGGCSISVDIASTSIGTVINTIPANALQTDLGSNANAATDNLTVNFAAPAITKGFTTSPINIGGVSTLTLTLSNPNGTALTGAAITDTYPVQIINATPSNVVTTCGGTVTAIDGGPSVSLSGGAIPALGSCTITVEVTSSTAGTHTNTTSVVSTAQAPNSSTASDDLIVNAAPTVSKNFATDPIAYGATSVLTITLGNTNATAATLSAALIDTLPTAGNGDVVIAASPNIGGTCNSADVTAAAGGSTITYAAGASIPSGGCSITVDISSTSTGTHTNTISVGALQTDMGNNTVAANDDITVNPSVAPSVSKIFSPDPISVNGTSTLTITLGNTNGVAAILSADLVDTLPTNVVIENPANIGGTCPGTTNATIGGGTVTYTNGSLIPVGGCTITVDVTSSVAGNYTNTIPVGALQTDIGNNLVAASDNLTINITAPPTVAKSFSPNTINAGGTSQLTVTLGNTNASAITLTANMDDNLPAGVTATSLSGATTCPGTVDISTNTLVRYTNGSSIPGGGCIIVVNVTSSTLGVVTNTIIVGALQTNVGSNASTTRDNLTVNASGGSPSCPSGTTLVTLGTPRNADVVVAGNPFNPTQALGTILSLGSGTNDSNSARLVNSRPTMTLDLTDTVPQNGTIILSIARNNNGGNYDVDSSSDNVSFAGVINFSAGPNDISQQISYTAPSGGTRFVRFTRNGGSLWVDGAQYSQICEPVPQTDLSITKDDGSATYTPGGTATYTITVTNAGPSNANGASVNDILPRGVSFNGSVTCVANGTANCGTITTGNNGGDGTQDYFNAIGINVNAGVGNSAVYTVPVLFSPDMTDY